MGQRPVERSPLERLAGGRHRVAAEVELYSRIMPDQIEPCTSCSIGVGATAIGDEELEGSSDRDAGVAKPRNDMDCCIRGGAFYRVADACTAKLAAEEHNISEDTVVLRIDKWC